MTNEENIFKRYCVDFDKLEKYGFKKNKNGFVFETTFMDKTFKAVISIDFEGKVSGIVYDLENDDEFLLLRVEGSQGAFVGEVRAAYEDVLKNIREKCFTRKYFIYPQTNRIANLVIEKYGDRPEFLWEKFSGTGVFRNAETGKWYLVILDVDRSKIQAKRKGVVEIADVKLSPENIERLLKEKDFYPGYHMNKKSWLTVILDDTVPDETIIKLIEESYNFTQKKSKTKG